MITGRTRFVPLLAHPCTHVRTPGVFNAECAARGIDMIMVPVDVRPDALSATVAALRQARNLAGFVVTIPHKTAIAALCDRLMGAAPLIGSCNVVRREEDGTLIGGMFDGEGFVAGLRYCGFEPAGGKVLLIGAGGAASGIAFALAGAGVSRLSISNRSQEKAKRLAADLGMAFPAVEIEVSGGDPSGFDFVVNSTSLGMHDGDPLPVDPARLSPATVVAEAVMQPDVTALLAAAAQRGCRIHKGVHMVEHQIRMLVDFLV